MLQKSKQQFEERLNIEVAAQSVYYQDIFVGDGTDPAWRDILCAPKENLSRTPTCSTPTSTVSSASQLSTIIGSTTGGWMAGRPTPSPPCHNSPSSPTLPRRAYDNISVRSAPPLCRSSSAQMQPGCSPPTFMRHQRNWSTTTSQMRSFNLTASASTSSIFSRSPPMPRPQSLYVPFKGCVEQQAVPPPPPGRAARDILNALSYAPTQDSFSAETRQLALDEEKGYDEFTKSVQHKQPQPARSSWSYSPKLPCIPQSPKSKLRAKSSSMAALAMDQTSPKILRPRPRYPPNVFPDRPPPPYCQAVQKFPYSYSTTDIVTSVPSSPVPIEMIRANLTSATEFSDFVPIYSPTNPLNHAENVALLVTHPPVIHPPPDIVANSPSPSNMQRNLSSPRG